MSALSFRFRAASLLGVAAFAAAACAEDTAGPPPDGGTTIPIAAVVPPAVSTLVVEVTAPDITDPLVFNLELSNGTASGEIVVPAGADRTITVSGFNAAGQVTHRGQVVVDVSPGMNPTVVITLVALAGDQPVSVILGEFTVEVTPEAADVDAGQTLQMTGQVLGGDGQPLVGPQLTWATGAPTVASVDQTGLVTGNAGGDALIVATFAGGGDGALITVLGAGVLRNKVVFTASGDIYSMGTDGTARTNLTGAGSGSRPDINPTGTLVAYGSSSGLEVMAGDGSNVSPLTFGNDGWPRWSPDGALVAFLRFEGPGDLDVHIVNADGSGLLALDSPGADGLSGLSWAPDASKLAFASDRDGNAEIYIVNSDGTGLTNITNHASEDDSPAWSPDGSSIAFRTFRAGNNEIFLMDADGQNPVNLTTDAAFDLAPVWSPDGTRIAFASGRSGGIDLWVMNADGTAPVNLSNNPSSNDSNPVWSADGGSVFFVSDRDGNDEIYRVNVDGTGLTNLTNDPADDENPKVSP